MIDFKREEILWRRKAGLVFIIFMCNKNKTTSHSEINSSCSDAARVRIGEQRGWREKKYKVLYISLLVLSIRNVFGGMTQFAKYFCHFRQFTVGFHIFCISRMALEQQRTAFYYATTLLLFSISWSLCVRSFKDNSRPGLHIHFDIHFILFFWIWLPYQVQVINLEYIEYMLKKVSLHLSQNWMFSSHDEKFYLEHKNYSQ